MKLHEFSQNLPNEKTLSNIFGTANLDDVEDHICKTPEAIYHINVLSTKRQVTVTVDLPHTAIFPEIESEAIQLEDTIHNAMENALASMFTK